MRHPFFNMTRLTLRKGQVDFHVLEGREGLIVTLGPNASIFDRPGRSVSRWAGTKNILQKSPHPDSSRSRIARELNFLSRVLWGGGDVKFKMIQAPGEQREVLLTAGDGNVLEKINLTDLSEEGAPSLLFLQPSYLCSSSEVEIRSQFCTPSIMSWARAPFVYMARAQKCGQDSFLCISGRTMLWSERLEPGEKRLIALGNVIAVTENVVCTLQPTDHTGLPDTSAEPPPETLQGPEDAVTAAAPSRKAIKKQKARDFGASVKILFNSIKAREGFFQCELTNQSDRPGFVYIQLNKTNLYAGSGLLGFLIRMLSSFFRWGDAALGG
ncbi:MAG: hypothetical protein ACR650_07300 [Methylocystis sp.]